MCFDMKFGAFEWALAGNVFLVLILLAILIQKLFQCHRRKEKKLVARTNLDYNLNTIYQRPNVHPVVQRMPMTPLTRTPSSAYSATLPSKTSRHPYWIAMSPTGPPSSLNISTVLTPYRFPRNSIQHQAHPVLSPPLHSCYKNNGQPLSPTKSFSRNLDYS